MLISLFFFILYVPNGESFPSSRSHLAGQNSFATFSWAIYIVDTTHCEFFFWVCNLSRKLEPSTDTLSARKTWFLSPVGIFSTDSRQQQKQQPRKKKAKIASRNGFDPPTRPQCLNFLRVSGDLRLVFAFLHVLSSTAVGWGQNLSALLFFSLSLSQKQVFLLLFFFCFSLSRRNLSQSVIQMTVPRCKRKEKRRFELVGRSGEKL